MSSTYLIFFHVFNRFASGAQAEQPALQVFTGSQVQNYTNSTTSN